MSPKPWPARSRRASRFALSPRFIEAAAALTIAYLAFEIILLPQSSMRWLVVGVLGLFHGAYFAAFLSESGYHVATFLTGVVDLRAASHRVVRLHSRPAGAPLVLAPRRASGRVAAAGGRSRLVFPASARVATGACASYEYMRSFDSLSEREILALAISLEEEDERVYAEYAEGLRENFPASAAVFDGMREEESGHRRRLIELFRKKFGEHIPLIRRQDVRGFVHRNPVWLMQPLGLDTVRNQASAMEVESRRFYEKAAARAQDAGVRQLLDDLAQEERTHEDRAEELEKTKLQPDVKHREDEANRRLFVLQIVQPGLAGLMDGSVSTLAPVFAAALATQSSFDAFKVGLAASLGAGISMGFAEALSDDGSLTGRGHPWARGIVCGLMTALGGIGHTLPFLIPGFRLAMIVAGTGGGGRARRHFVDPAPLHGHAAGIGGSASGPRAACWCFLTGVSDRQLLTRRTQHQRIEKQLERLIALRAILRAHPEKHRAALPQRHLHQCRAAFEIRFAQQPSGGQHDDRPGSEPPRGLCCAKERPMPDCPRSKSQCSQAAPYAIGLVRVERDVQQRSRRIEIAIRNSSDVHSSRSRCRCSTA